MLLMHKIYKTLNYGPNYLRAVLGRKSFNKEWTLQQTLNKFIKPWSAINAFYCMLISMSNI